MFVLLVVLVLAGCSASGPAPVGERGTADIPRSGVHEVRRGETLFRIAWRYGLDWRALAQRNDLSEPYTIRPGQQLRLRSGSSTTRQSTAGSRQASSSGSSARPSASAPAAKPSASNAGGHDWQWPLAGEVVQRFAASGAQLNKGLDLRGTAGAALAAAAAGEVVYAGSGLRGFGQLIILKHDSTWLSAYAHNSRSLVSEGEQVARGGRLAVLGDSERRRTVHFEIRRQGKPVDPASVLPAR